MYSIKLADDTVLDELELNGNNYIPSVAIDKAVFEDNLRKVSITDSDGNIEEMNDVKIVFSRVGDKESFILTEKTKEEKEKELIKREINDQAELISDIIGGVFSA